VDREPSIGAGDRQCGHAPAALQRQPGLKARPIARWPPVRHQVQRNALPREAS